MAFERFKKTGRGYTPKVSIWLRGQIGFNHGAVQKYNISDWDYAILYFDKDEQKIGIKFTNDASEKGVCKITKGKTGAFISAKPFLSYYDISHEKTKKYDVEFDDENDMYVVSLK
jgi:hypothetical protein